MSSVNEKDVKFINIFFFFFFFFGELFTNEFLEKYLLQILNINIKYFFGKTMN